jgi:hypothetical protein
VTFLGHTRLSTAQIYTRVSVGRMMQTYNQAHPHSGEVRVKNVHDELASVEFLRDLLACSKDPFTCAVNAHALATRMRELKAC